MEVLIEVSLCPYSEVSGCQQVSCTNGILQGINPSNGSDIFQFSQTPRNQEEPVYCFGRIWFPIFLSFRRKAYHIGSIFWALPDVFLHYWISVSCQNRKREISPSSKINCPVDYPVYNLFLELNDPSFFPFFQRYLVLWKPYTEDGIRYSIRSP